MREFKKLNVASMDLNRVQDNVETVLLSLRTPFSDSLLLTNIQVVSGDNSIPHKLGRVLQGWLVVGISAGVTLYDKQASNPLKDKILILHSSGTATMSLVVF